MKRVHVAVAVIVSASQNILIARRPDDKHQGGLWEFPGGKVEGGETTVQALVRELQEEVALTVSSEQMSSLTEIAFDYPDKQVYLDVLWVEVPDSAQESAHGAEGQPTAWTAVSELSNYAFPAANQPILDAIQQRLSGAAIH